MALPHDFFLIDIGARGNVHPRWNILGSNLRAVLFEPDPDAKALLEANLDDSWVVIGRALAGTKGTREFYLLKWRACSSLLPANREFLARYPVVADLTQVDKKSTLQVDTLDALLEEHDVPRADFIKLDTQGTELEILKAAPRALESAIGLEVEVEFQPLYVDQPLFYDVDAFVRDNGFEFLDLRRQYWKREVAVRQSCPGKGQIVFGDALYFRSPESLLSSDADADLVWRAIQAYAAYKQFDLAHTLVEKADEAGILDPEAKAAMAGFLKTSSGPKPCCFRGRHRLHRWLQRLTNRAKPREWFELDLELGE